MVVCSSIGKAHNRSGREVVLGTVSFGIFGISMREMAVRGDMVIKHVNIKV